MQTSNQVQECLLYLYSLRTMHLDLQGTYKANHQCNHSNLPCTIQLFNKKSPGVWSRKQPTHSLPCIMALQRKDSSNTQIPIMPPSSVKMKGSLLMSRKMLIHIIYKKILMMSSLSLWTCTQRWRT
jgi:hypothetical protein